MQTMFADRTDWHVPWLERVLPRVPATSPRQGRGHDVHQVRAAAATRGEQWRLARIMRQRIQPDLIALLPPLRELAPPAEVIDK